MTIRPARLMAAVMVATGGAAIALATPGVMFTSTPLARSTAVTGIHVMENHVRVDNKAAPAQVNDVLVQHVVAHPGGSSGWHSHPGYGIVVVRSGVATIYDGDDPTCTPHYVGAGEVFTETPGHVHFVLNEGTTDYEAYATFILPVGAQSRTDVSAPGNCPF